MKNYDHTCLEVRRVLYKYPNPRRASPELYENLPLEYKIPYRAVYRGCRVSRKGYVVVTQSLVRNFF